MGERSSHPVEDAAIEDWRRARGEFEAELDSEQLAKVRAQWLGKHGRFKQYLREIAKLPLDERRTVGKKINELAAHLEQLHARVHMKLEAASSACEGSVPPKSVSATFRQSIDVGQTIVSPSRGLIDVEGTDVTFDPT